MSQIHRIEGLRGVLGAFIFEIECTTVPGSLFRGVSSSERHQLIPSIGRLLPVYEASGRGKVRLLHDERDALIEFAEQCPLYVPGSPLDQFELMLLAQHHGLPTRMLDWTFNALVALHCAVSDNVKEDGAVFVLRQTKAALAWKTVESGFASPFELPAPVGMLPRHTNPRIAAQASAVIIHPDPTEEFRSEHLDRIVIRADEKVELQISLRRVGVHDQSLFPGLDGLAKRVGKRSFTSPDALEWWRRMGISSTTPGS